MSQPNEVFGMDTTTAAMSDEQAHLFVIEAVLSKLNTVTLVKVVSCTNSGDLSPVGFVDVQPMVHQMTGDRKPIKHGVIHNVPYFRIQGGANAVIIDPQKGDIGMCAFASRDISSIKKNKGASPPPSHRTFDWADGLYLGGFLNGTPSQYVQFSDGIKISSPKKIELDAPTIKMKGAVEQSGGEVTVETTVSAGEDMKVGGVSLKGHKHNGVQAGSDNTGAPVAYYKATGK